jgi:centrosomal protein CEP135
LNNAEALSKQHDAMSQAMKLATRNEELEKELRDIDHVALAVEADCNSTVKENNRRVCKLQVMLTSLSSYLYIKQSLLFHYFIIIILFSMSTYLFRKN